jgi:selenocysteine lyase/cysteine desulfurase
VESRDGKIYLEDLEAKMDEKTAAISVCAVTVGSGFRFDLPEVCALAKRYGAPLVVDGAQIVGLLDINLAENPLDFLVGTFSRLLSVRSV